MMVPRPAGLGGADEGEPVLDRASPRLAELVTRLQPSMLRLARTITSTDAVAVEVVQDTWVAVLEGIAGFRAESSLKTWIFTILVKHAYTRAKVEGRSVPFSAREKEPTDEAFFDGNGRWLDDHAPRCLTTPEDDAIARQRVRILSAALEGLPAAQRAVVVLRDVEQLSAADACNILGVSETNQRVLLHRGRCALRAVLEGDSPANRKSGR